VTQYRILLDYLPASKRLYLNIFTRELIIALVC